jgi:hypothetical protein
MNWAVVLRRSDFMARLFVEAEGQTEENFVDKILAPLLYGCGYTVVSARLLGNARQRDHRGGIKSWDSARRDILDILRKTQTAS